MSAHFASNNNTSLVQYKANFPKLNILLVEDDLILQTVCKYYLNELGYTRIDLVKSAASALRRPLAKYDLIISDFNLGTGLNGVQLADMVQVQLGKSLPFILVSTHDDVAIAEALLTCKAGCFLKKPFSMAELKEAIENCPIFQQSPEAALAFRFQAKNHKKSHVVAPSTLPSIHHDKDEPGLPFWVEMIQDLVEGAGFSYSRIAYRIKVSPSTIQKLATNQARKPRQKVFHPLVCLYYKVFQGPYASAEAESYWRLKQEAKRSKETAAQDIALA